MSNGGYDAGYRACPCFWGDTPGSLVEMLVKRLEDLAGLTVLDAGCGEGKNAAYLAGHGARVQGIDISPLAIENAKRAWPEKERLKYQVADIRSYDLESNCYDVVIAYGLLHCFQTVEEIEMTLTKIQKATKNGGYNVICAFNERQHEFKGAHAGFEPLLISHKGYLDFYKSWNVIYESDTDLKETHPHDMIEHTHSMTRILAQR